MVYSNRRLLVATPAHHIDGLIDKLKNGFAVRYEPDALREAAIAACQNTQAIFVNPNKMTYRLDSDFFNQCSDLKVIATASTGTNHIDMDAAKRAGIQVLSLTKRLDVIERISGTAELALALTLAVVRNVPKSMDSVVIRGEWNYEPYIGRQIAGLTVGVVGYGRLGKMYARYLAAMDATVLVHDPYVEKIECGTRVGELDELAARCDIIALHVHVTPETKGLISSKFISLCKKRPYIINTSRADIVDEQAIIAGLKNEALSGYGTDVLKAEFSEELAKSPIITAAQQGLNIVITPHIGGMTREGQHMAYHATADSLLACDIQN